MAATREVAGQRVARAARPGRARTTCEGVGSAIVDGRSGRAKDPHGAVLDLAGPDLRIAVADAEKRTILSFGPFPEEDVIAIWRALGRAAGLVPMIKSHEETKALAGSLGPLRVSAPSPRRRRPICGRPRPRFLARRKIGQVEPRSSVPRGS